MDFEPEYAPVQSTVNMRREAREDLRKSEEDLDRVYRQIPATSDQKVKDADLRKRLKAELEQSEAAWLQYRPLETRIRNDIHTP